MASTHDTFQSVFSWRYGSGQMRHIWSEEHKRRLMRRVWVALATAQHKAGLVSADQLVDLERQQDNVDVERASTIEKETRHDVMAEIHVYAEQCPVGGGIIHWGATSADITDNVDALRIREAVLLLTDRLTGTLDIFVAQIEKTANLPVMALTHIQPAEPTTLGYRLSVYAQDLLEDLEDLRTLTATIKGKGFKGAVGSQASFHELLQGTGMSPAEMEAEAMACLELPYYAVTTQIYSRRQDLRVIDVLAGIAASLHKFALDFRVLASPATGEWFEPFGEKQVGSSAMPFKRNPINMENICSLARYVAALPAVAWQNAANSILERSLDDSANRRLFLPEGFLAVDEMLLRTTYVLKGMQFDERAIRENLARFGPFAATERVLMALVTAGADRQSAHEWIRQASLEAWQALGRGEGNLLQQLILSDENIGHYLSADRLLELLDAGDYTGTTGERALQFAGKLRSHLAS